MKIKVVFLILCVLLSCTGRVEEKIIIKDSTIVNYIDSLLVRDSTAITYKDSLRIIDSTVVNYRDSVVIKGRKSLFPLLGDSLIEITKHLRNIRTFDFNFNENPVDSFRSGIFSPMNLFDDLPYRDRNELGTRWARSGNWDGNPKYHGLALTFDETYLITKVKINVFGYERLKTKFILFNGLQKVLSDSTELNKLYTEFDVLFTNEENIHFYIYDSENEWLDVGEIKIYGYPVKRNYIPDWSWVKSKIGQ
ncbi:MAG: hypothetical protein CR986_01970 [Ignavibacteriae bacterium]|nr:MAG: hypothetical protein CR986_01970 [Ignavibacteriota bacterium]